MSAPAFQQSFLRKCSLPAPRRSPASSLGLVSPPSPLSLGHRHLPHLSNRRNRLFKYVSESFCLEPPSQSFYSSPNVRMRRGEERRVLWESTESCVCGVRGGQEARLVTCHHMSTPKSTLPPFHTNDTCMSK